ncbi:hypothetical protein YC2023_028260 [Brassica napus]
MFLDLILYLNTATASMYCGDNKIETFTVAELNKYVLTSPLQSTEFLCDGKFMGIQTENTSCSNCSKKLQECFRPSHALHVQIQSLWCCSVQVRPLVLQLPGNQHFHSVYTIKSLT